MKTKTKILAVVEIAIVLCSLFLVALPAIAAQEQNQEMQKVSASEVTTASEDDYVLGIYGNANEDDTIDMRDLTYVKLIFFGKKPVMELADAKYDGKINPLDFIQIKLIIVGKEKELTIADSADRVVTVKKPVKRVITITQYPAEAIRMFGEKDKIVGVGSYFTKEDIYFPELSKLPPVGSQGNPDVEAILSLNPDLVILWWKTAELAEKLPGIPVVTLRLYKPYIFVEELKKLGYIMDKEDRVDNYFSTFHAKYIDLIKVRAEKLSKEEKPKVYVESDFGDYKPYGSVSGAQMYIEIAGGRNIFGDLPLPGNVEVDPEEVIMRNPDIIIRHLAFRHGHDVGYGVDDLSEMKSKREEIMNRPELANVTAVKKENVYIMDEGMTYGLDYPIAIIYMARWFHSDLFKDLDPQELHQEYIDRFCPGLDYDVKEHGVFVYPEPS